MQKKRRESVFADKALQSYLNEISQYQALSREEEHELALLANQGDKEAINKLIQANLKFVVKIATRFQNRGLSLAELISEGNIGLIKAIEKFDPSKDIKLISYAIWWIKQRIMLAVSEKSSLIRVPMGKSSQANKLKAVSERVFSMTGQTPTDADLVELMEMDEKAIDQLRGQMHDTLSIDDFVSNNPNQEVNISDNLEDKDVSDPQTLYYRERMHDKLANAINRLEPREADIIRTYYGLDNVSSAKNFAEIASEMGLSRERVRQIQKEALKKIMDDLQPAEEKLVDTFIDQYDYL
jgi:RNA polymerase primary sigma factor